MLDRNHRLATIIQEADFCMEPFCVLQKWQLERLSASYADLSAEENSRPACEFFLRELYGGFDFLQRDRDMERVMPAMIRFLPRQALHSLSGAFELQAISLEFDMGMARIMAERGLERLDIARYASVYRACGDRPGRERQIRLIRQLGQALARLVRRPYVRPLVRLLHGPAHAAGFGQLQDFLENGLAAYRRLDQPGTFIDTIYRREWESMNKLFARDPDPFRV